MDIEDKDIEQTEGMVTAENEDAAVVISLDVDTPSGDGISAEQGPVGENTEEATSAEDAGEAYSDAAANDSEAGATAAGIAESQDAAAKEKGDTLSLHGLLGNKTIEDVIAREAKEEDSVTNFSLSKTLGGVTVAWFVQKQIKLVLLVCVFIIIYINNRYTCQNKLVEIDKTQALLVKARYKATVCTSRLTEQSRESFILELLDNYGDSTLAIPSDPPYLITVPEEE